VDAIAEQMRQLDAYQIFGDFANDRRCGWPTSGRARARWTARRCSSPAAAVTPIDTAGKLARATSGHGSQSDPG